MDINDLLQKRGEIVEQMNKLLEKAESEKRDLNSEEQTSFDKMHQDQADLKIRADRMKTQDDLQKEIRSSHNDVPHKISIEDTKNPYANKDYLNAFDKYARIGKASLDHDYLNALQIGTDTEGGYITPEEFEKQIVEALQDINDIRKFATTITTASDRNIPIESALGVAEWTAEEGLYNESDAVFDRIILGAHKLTTIIKVSEELLQDAFFNLQGYLARNFGKRFGLAEEEAYINGDGNEKPTGILPDSQFGVDAGMATAIGADKLIDLFYSLKRMYRKKARWLMNDSTVKLIRKLKGEDQQYLWQPGLQADQPDRLLGRPLTTSDAMPVVAADNRSVVFGDLSYYTIADRSNTVMQRLNELYAANGQIGFRMFKRTEGKVILPEAFKHLLQSS